MADYRRMYDDKDYLYAFDLEECPVGEDGRPERTLEIAGVARVELTGENNKKSKKPGVTFKGEPKRLALNKTNGKVIAKLYGKDTDDWVGQRITIYATTTEFGGETRDCIRVRPRRPEAGNDSRNDSRRQDRADRADRGGNSGRGRSGQAQGKPDRAAAESSAIAAKYLIEQYARIEKFIADGHSPGIAEDEMAKLKVERGKHWEAMAAADREAVATAAKSAKARIDAAIAAGAGAPGPGNSSEAPAPAPAAAETGQDDSDSRDRASYGPDDDDDDPDPDADLDGEADS